MHNLDLRRLGSREAVVMTRRRGRRWRRRWCGVEGGSGGTEGGGGDGAASREAAM
jgi:hypothetical protein